MQIFKRIDPLRAYLNSHRRGGNVIGLVPTMGALHSGHISLVDASKKDGDLTVCTLFVNPTQFNNPNDLAKYPRDLAADEALLKQANCDVLFAPDTKEMYDSERQIHFDPGRLGEILEGKFRPGHFSGVALVVTKLFNIVRPDQAYFGLKDYQQFRIISLLNEELKFGIRLHGMPTIREQDGLAMSSRNMRLTPDERAQATALYRALQQARRDLLEGISWEKVQSKTASLFSSSPLVRMEYFSLVDKDTLDNPVKRLSEAILLIAAHVGNVRLIDNLDMADQVGR